MSDKAYYVNYASGPSVLRSGAVRPTTIAPALALLLAACAAAPADTRGHAATPAAPLDDSAIDVGLEHVRAAAGACVGALREPSTWMVRLTIRNDGRVTEVHADNADLPDPTVSMCLENAIARAVFPGFTGPPMTTTVPFELR